MYTRARDASGAIDGRGILRDADGAYIPADPGNVDWGAYQNWLAAGNQPSDPPPFSPPPRQASGAALRDALKATGRDTAWQTALAGQSQDTRDWWTTRYTETVPITAVKLVRIAQACLPPVDLDKLFKAAGA